MIVKDNYSPLDSNPIALQTVPRLMRFLRNLKRVGQSRWNLPDEARGTGNVRFYSSSCSTAIELRKNLTVDKSIGISEL